MNVAAADFVDKDEAGRGIRILEGESGDDQGEERDQQQEVLNALVLGHAHNHPGTVGVMAAMLCCDRISLRTKIMRLCRNMKPITADDHQDVNACEPS